MIFDLNCPEKWLINGWHNREQKDDGIFNRKWQCLILSAASVDCSVFGTRFNWLSRDVILTCSKNDILKCKCIYRMGSNSGPKYYYVPLRYWKIESGDIDWEIKLLNTYGLAKKQKPVAHAT